MRTQIIAEIASSHNGDLELAKAMIKTAAECGADLVKFQDWRASNVPDTDPDKSRYERIEFKESWYSELISYCATHGVEFLTTCFNADRAEFLAKQGLKKIKLASISLTNKELLLACCSNFEEIIVSTAMHSRDEIEDAVDLLSKNAKSFSILHCVANYPLDPKDANLGRFDALQAILEGMFGDGWITYCSLGYSDHSLDLDVSKVALSMDIKYLEKHFSLSRHLPQTPHQMYKDGPMVTTHEISIEPHELKELAEWRDKVTVVRGTGDFVINNTEQKIKDRYSNRYGK